MSDELLSDFVAYCKAHPEERFWQALRNWSGKTFILAVIGDPPEDTFFWQHRDH